MRIVLFTAFILSLSACGDSANKSGSSSGQLGLESDGMPVLAPDASTITVPTPVPTLSESDFAALDRLEMIATAHDTHLDSDLQRDGSVLMSLSGQADFFLMSKLGFNFAGLSPRIVLPAAKGCILSVTSFSATDARGTSTFTLKGEDKSTDNRTCTRFLADIFHNGARLHFVNVPLTGFDDGKRVIPEVNVDVKPYY